MAEKILIIGTGSAGTSASMLEAIKEKYADDIVFVTPEEAKEQGYIYETPQVPKLRDFKIAAPLVEDLKNPLIPLSGKEKRRKRREQERKANKKRK